MRFGISETSWMLPKILRMRLDAAEERFCGALGAVVAMVIVSPRLRGRNPGKPSPRRKPGILAGLSSRWRSEGEARCESQLKTQKAASPASWNRSFSVLKTPPDQCVGHAARRRCLFRCEWGAGAR